jgi:capsular exopolysaccharide synthesis family protein
MSHFFRALEQAERDRAQRDEERRSAAAAPVTDADPPAPPPPERRRAALRIAPAVDSPGADAPVAPVGDPEPAVEAPRAPDEAPDLAGIDDHLASLLAPASLAAEHYRVLAHVVDQHRHDGEALAVAVTSAGTGDGKTVTAANLAGALAHARGARVLLVELDLRCPALARRLALADDAPMLPRALADPACGLQDVVVRLAPFNLDVLVAGRPVPSPYELLKSTRIAELLRSARARYDYVVVDAPPAAPFPDARAIARLVDGFLVVVGAHRTASRMLEDALAALPPDRVMGLVFNGDDEPRPGAYAERMAPAAVRRRLRRYVDGGRPAPADDGVR